MGASELVAVSIPIVVTGIVFFTIAFIIQTILRHRLRSRIVAAGITDKELLEKIFTQEKESKEQSLKWGLIFLFGGLGLVVLEFIPYGVDSSLPYGIETAFIATGFLCYYFLVNKRPVTK